MTKTIRNISSTIWEKDIPAIVAKFKAEGISVFTISSSPCGLIETLAAFEANGAKVQGLTRTEASYLNWETGKPEEIPAILMKIM